MWKYSRPGDLVKKIGDSRVWCQTTYIAKKRWHTTYRRCSLNVVCMDRIQDEFSCRQRRTELYSFASNAAATPQRRQPLPALRLRAHSQSSTSTRVRRSRSTGSSVWSRSFFDACSSLVSVLRRGAAHDRASEEQASKKKLLCNELPVDGGTERSAVFVHVHFEQQGGRWKGGKPSSVVASVANEYLRWRQFKSSRIHSIGTVGTLCTISFTFTLTP